MPSKWTYTALNDWRQCNRKYYFSQIAPSHYFTKPLRRKAFELKNTQNLAMFQGSVIDKIIETKMAPSFQWKQKIDFEDIANEAVKLAKTRFEFSLNAEYKDPSNTKSKAGEAYCILDIHESGVSYTNSDIENIYSGIYDTILNFPKVTITEEKVPILEFLSQATNVEANINRYSFEFENIRVAPQIDLIATFGKTEVAIDWKVSNTKFSDYSRQLFIIGTSMMHSNHQIYEKTDPQRLKFSDIQLFEVNLWQRTSKKHEFTQLAADETIDYIFLNHQDKNSLKNGLKFEDNNIEHYTITDKPTTCKMCKFRNLCTHLINNKFKYDEKKYNKLVQN